MYTRNVVQHYRRRQNGFNLPGREIPMSPALGFPVLEGEKCVQPSGKGCWTESAVWRAPFLSYLVHSTGRSSSPLFYLHIERREEMKRWALPFPLPPRAVPAYIVRSAQSRWLVRYIRVFSHQEFTFSPPAIMYWLNLFSRKGISSEMHSFYFFYFDFPFFLSIFSHSSSSSSPTTQ